MNPVIRCASLIILIALFGLGTKAAAQTTPDSISLTGYIVTLHSDPPPDSAAQPQQVTLLQTATGSNLAQLSLDPAAAVARRGQQVQVTGHLAASTAASQAFNAPLLQVTGIELAGSAAVQTAGMPATGAQPWINLLCQFSDNNTAPYTPAQYQSLFSSTYPGLDHYWRQISYDQINLTGTAVVSRWYVLPLPRAGYIPSSGPANLELLFNDCTAAADADVNFTQYTGINLMFNDWLDCCAWGGEQTATLDGLTKTWSVTWLPPWSQTFTYLAHEMGHGFGLLHSSGPSANPPSGTAIYISQWDVMSKSQGSCQVKDKNFGCLPPGTIAHQLELAGWMPENRIATVQPGQIVTLTLDRLRQPPSSTGYLMAKIPIGDISGHHYTVEARFRLLGHSNYDQNIPASTIVIHDVLPGRGGWPGTNTGPALVVVANPFAGTPAEVVNGEEARWKQGEVFYDEANDIRIQVTGQNADTFTLSIANHALAAPSPLAPAGLATAAVPVFTWTAVERAVRYDIQLDTRSDFSSGAVISAQTAAATYTAPGALAANRTYYWRVRAQTAVGTLSGWSVAGSFMLESDAAAIPLPQYTTSTPTLSWGPVTWATGYDVMVSRTAAFNTVSFQAALNANTLAVTTAPLEHGQHFWRVCVRCTAGASVSCSAAETFVINAP